MKAILSGLAALVLLAATPAGAAQRDCVVEGWTSGSWTRPIFKCPEPEESGTVPRPRKSPRHHRR